MARSPLASLSKMAALVFDLLHECSPRQRTLLPSPHFQQHLVRTLRAQDDTDGGGVGEGEVLEGLATALQATAEVLSVATTEGEREKKEGRWRARVLQELMINVMKDVARLVLDNYL